MIPRKLRRFTYLKWGGCCPGFQMEYDDHDDQYYCIECYRYAKIAAFTADSNDNYDVVIEFYRGMFIQHLRQLEKFEAKRLIIVYIRSCGGNDEEVYKPGLIETYYLDIVAIGGGQLFIRHEWPVIYAKLK